MDNFLFIPRALAATFYDAAFAAAFGMVLGSLWLGREEAVPLRASLRRGVFTCAAIMLLALCAQAYLATATMIASSAFAEVRGQLLSVLTDTHAGRNLVATGAVVLVLLLVLLFIRRTGRSQIWVSLALLIALAAVRSANGHAASDGDFTLPECVQFIHLTAIAVWAGGVIAGGLLVLPALLRGRNGDAMLAFTRRLSLTVTSALLLVVLSGVYNSYRGLAGTIKPLAHTQWGLLLDAKIALVLAASAMGALNRRMLQHQTLTPQQSTCLTTTLRYEAIIMLLILTISAFLANSPPATAM